MSDTDFDYVLTHVDDLLLAGLGDTFLTFEQVLSTSFPDITTQLNDSFTYLGMSIIRDRDNHSIVISQRPYITTVLKTFGMSDCKPASTPCTVDLLEPEQGSIVPCDKTLYLSIVMSLMYLARLSRPDILFAVTYLSTKSAQPSMRDLSHAKHILRYLRGSINQVLRFAGTKLDLCLYADASHGIYADGKGHHAVLAIVGGDEILKSSHRIRCVTLSSTESEIIAAVDAATYLRWLILLFQDLGIPVDLPITLHQDNQSAIHMIEHGCTWKKSKHMIIRVHFARGLIEEGIVKLVYTPTDEMYADVHTKPYTGAQLVRYTIRVFTKLP